MKESLVINQYISQLYDNNKYLINDCAEISGEIFKNNNLIINNDSLIEGCHFFAKDSPKSVAHKLVHRNLSDLAGMGALPIYWVLSLSINQNIVNHQWLQEFITELKVQQDKYKFSIISGDTSFVKELNLGATFIGYIKDNYQALQLNKAQEDEIICFSNFIGDAYIGLLLLKNQYAKKSKNIFSNLSQSEKNYFINAYHYPEAQVELGTNLLQFASTATDISDGLIKDLEKILKFSNIGAKINLNKIKFSNPLNNILESYNIKQKNNLIKKLITAGDDYQLIFTITKNNLKKLLHKLESTNTIIQEIGVVSKEISHMQIILNEKEINLKTSGFEHK